VAAELTACYAKGDSNYNTDIASADKHYNQCIDPFGTDEYAKCRQAALDQCGSDNSCLNNGIKACDAKWLDPNGICQLVKNDEYNAAAASKSGWNSKCADDDSAQAAACPIRLADSAARIPTACKELIPDRTVSTGPVRGVGQATAAIPAKETRAEPAAPFGATAPATTLVLVAAVEMAAAAAPNRV
jgi:hypothetical protein